MASRIEMLSKLAFELLLLGALLSQAAICTAAASKPRTISGDQQVDGMVQHIAAALDTKAEYYFDKGDYHRVVADYRVEVEADPHDVQSYSGGGWLLESDKQYRDAEAFYQLGCTRNPTSSFAAFQLGFFYFHTMHDYHKAVGVMSKSVHFADADANDWKLLAHSYVRDGDLNRALATWKETKKLFPSAQAVDLNIQQVQATINKSSAAKKAR